MITHPTTLPTFFVAAMRKAISHPVNVGRKLSVILLVLGLVWAQSPPSQGRTFSDTELTPIGPWGGAIYDLEVFPGEPSHVVVATDAGVFHSTSRGKTWESMGQGQISGLKVRHVHISADGKTLLAGGRALQHDSGSPSVMVSLDSGESWKALPLSDTLIGLGYDLESRKYFAAFPNRVMASADGNTWSQVHSSKQSFYGFAVSPHAGGGSWLGASETNGSLLRSGSNGFKSVQKRFPGNTGGRACTDLAFHPAQKGMMYATVYGQGLRSENNGKSWEVIWDAFEGKRDYMKQNSLRFMWVHPQPPHVLYGGTHKALYSSIDQGNSWKKVMDGRVRPFSSKGLGITLASSVDGHVYVSRDGRNFQPYVPLGLNAGGIAALALNDKGNMVVSANGQVLRNSGIGGNWVMARTPGKRPPGELVLPSVRYLIAAGDGRLWSSADVGQSWSPKKGPVTENKRFAITGLAQQVNFFWVATSDGLQQVDLHLQRWKKVNPAPVRFLQVLDEQTVVYAANDGPQISKNLGRTWSPLKTERNFAPYTVTMDSKGRVYSSTSNGVLLHENGKVTDISKGLPEVTVARGITQYKIKAMKVLNLEGEETLVAGTPSGLYRRTLPKGKWISWKLSGLTSNRVSGLHEIMWQQQRHLLLLTENAGAFVLALDSVPVTE